MHTYMTRRPDLNCLMRHVPTADGCQFFITFRATAHLDGRHTVFGYVDCRTDDESERVLQAMEATRTDRRSDRPLEPLRIVDCGIIGESGKKSEANEATKLVGEAKKNKLMQAYGEKDGGDADEIDLEEGDESGENEINHEKRDERDTPKGDDAGEIALDDDDDVEEEEDPVPEGKLTKKAALQKRLKGRYRLRRHVNEFIILRLHSLHKSATEENDSIAQSQ